MVFEDAKNLYMYLNIKKNNSVEENVIKKMFLCSIIIQTSGKVFMPSEEEFSVHSKLKSHNFTPKCYNFWAKLDKNQSNLDI